MTHPAHSRAYLVLHIINISSKAKMFWPLRLNIHPSYWGKGGRWLLSADYWRYCPSCLTDWSSPVSGPINKSRVYQLQSHRLVAARLLLAAAGWTDRVARSPEPRLTICPNTSPQYDGLYELDMANSNFYMLLYGILLIPVLESIKN